MGPPAVAGEFRLEQGGEEEGVVRQLGDAYVARLVDAAEAHSARPQHVRTGRVGAVRTVVTLNGPLGPEHALRQRSGCHLDRAFVADEGAGQRDDQQVRRLGMAAPADPLHLPDAGPLTTTARAEQPLAVALPTGHPLADRAGLRLADLADAQWIEAPDTAVPLAQLRAASGSDGYRTSLRHEGTDVRGLTALITAGHGLALLPHQALDDLPGIHAVPLRTPRLVHRTEALHHEMPDGPTARLAAALVAAS